MAESLGLDIAKNFVQKGSIAVDVGAGIYSGGADYVKALLNSVGEEGKVYAFDSFSIDTIPNAPNLIKVDKPVWSSSGKFKSEILFPWGIPVAMSTGKAPPQKDEYEAISLDDYFPTEKIDFIKMDIEGAESQALLGMKNLIDRSPNFRMILECHWSYFNMFNKTNEDIWNFLQERPELHICSLSVSQPFKLITKEEYFNINLGSHILLTKDIIEPVIHGTTQ